MSAPGLADTDRMAGLKRELGARDLTLMAIAIMTGARWIPAAAHAGSGSILLWVLAALLFLIPLAIAITALTVRDPSAGGPYVWTRRDFGPWHGFLCFWVYWMAMVIWVPSAAMFYTSAAAYMLPRLAHLAGDRMYLVAASLVVIWVAQGTNIVGMKVGKWTQNLGALASWVLGAALAAFAALMWRRAGPATHFQVMPEMSWGTVNFWASIAYGVTGFEMIGMVGSEMHNPARDIPKAAWISSLFVTLFYAGSTAALLVILRPEKITELNGLAEAGQAAGAALGAAWLVPAIALLVLCSAVGQFGGIGASVARLPFAAGVDSMLPEPFGRIHSRWATPHLSMVFFGVVASGLLILIQLGDTARAAYETLVSLMVIAGFLPYVYMFGSAWKLGKRVSSLLGWAVTLLAIVCSIVPPEGVRVWLFEAKLAAGTAAVIGSAFVVYRRQLNASP
jgi:amino acid transporter